MPPGAGSGKGAGRAPPRRQDDQRLPTGPLRLAGIACTHGDPPAYLGIDDGRQPASASLSEKRWDGPVQGLSILASMATASLAVKIP